MGKLLSPSINVPCHCNGLFRAFLRRLDTSAQKMTKFRQYSLKGFKRREEENESKAESVPHPGASELAEIKPHNLR